MKSHVIILCLGFVFMTSVHSTPRKEWTKLILTQHWPKTFCITCPEMHSLVYFIHYVEARTRQMEKCTANFSYWTLHGLWPNTGAECNASWHFNASLIEDLLPEMKTYWPDLLKPQSTTFWKHEWTKHGTCAAQEEAMDSQHKYFNKALELYHKLDLDGVLKKSNIVPSENYYKFTDVEGSINSAFGVHTKIQCVSHEKESEFQILGQIEICFDKQFQLVDCEKSTEELQSRDEGEIIFNNNNNPGYIVCDASLPVYYPPLGSTLQTPRFL